MRGNIDYMKHFPPSGRHAYLGPKEVMELVTAIDAGCASPANLEKGGRGWRLRVTFNKPEGGVVRRSITIPDEETANWVKNFLVEARNPGGRR